MTTNPNPDRTAVSVVPPATNQTAPVDRAAVLTEAATRYEEILANANTGQDPRYWTAVRDITLGLRAMAVEAPQPETPDAVVARVLYVAEVIEANGIGWAADSVRRACRGDAEQPRACAHCGQVHDSSSLTHFGAPGGPWYCVDRDDCRGAGGLPPRKPVAAPAVVAQPGKETSS